MCGQMVDLVGDRQRPSLRRPTLTWLIYILSIRNSNKFNYTAAQLIFTLNSTNIYCVLYKYMLNYIFISFEILFCCGVTRLSLVFKVNIINALGAFSFHIFKFVEVYFGLDRMCIVVFFIK